MRPIYAGFLPFLAMIIFCTPVQTRALSADFTCPFEPGEAVEDPLDPMGYYPLEVGNAWEFELFEGATQSGFRTEEITSLHDEGDTLFFDVVVRFYTPVGENTYEKLQASVRKRGIATGGAVWLGGVTGEEWENHLRLDAPFRFCFSSDTEPVVAVEGETESFVVIEDDTVNVPARKHFEFGHWALWYAHGIGPVGGRSDPAFVTSLIHARVGGETFGTSFYERDITIVSTEPEELPGQIASLGDNYPNPFRAGTVIPFSMEDPQHVSLIVYDLLGREVAVLVSGVLPAGRHTVTFTASDVAPGLYVYRLTAGSFTETRKMTVAR